MANQCSGDLLLCELEAVIRNVRQPGEVGSSTWNDFIWDMTENEMSEREVKRNAANVWQYYGEKWRKYLDDPIRGSFVYPIYGGSHAEGLSNSQDLDVMYIATWIELYENKRNMSNDKEILRLRMVNSSVSAGYVNVILPSSSPFTEEYQFKKKGSRFYLRSDGYIRSITEWKFIGCECETHGPALTGLSNDIVHSLKCVQWPSFATDIFERTKSKGISKEHLKLQGVYVVPIGFSSSKDKDIEWRLSFTGVEKYIMSSWNDTKMFCYFLLRNFRKICLPETDVLCPYFLKTTLFWMCDLLPPEFWCKEHVSEIFVLALHVICYFLAHHSFPNYFVPENNMIRSRCKTECTKISQMIESLLSSGQMDIVMADSLCCTSIKDLFRLAGESLPSGIRRSHRIFCKQLSEGYLQADFSFQQQKVIYEVDHLTTLCPTMAIWDRSQCFAMEDLLESLGSIVSEKFVVVFKPLIKRKIADFYHNLGLRSSLQTAEKLYQESKSLVYHCGFDDLGFSGTVHLAFFKYLTGYPEIALEHLQPMMSLIESTVSLQQVDFYVCISLTFQKSKRFASDKLLYAIACELKKETPLYINSVVLAVFIIIQSLRKLAGTMETSQKSIIFYWFEIFELFSNRLKKEFSLQSFKVLHEKLCVDLQMEFGQNFRDLC